MKTRKIITTIFIIPLALLSLITIWFGWIPFPNENEIECTYDHPETVPIIPEINQDTLITSTMAFKQLFKMKDKEAKELATKIITMNPYFNDSEVVKYALKNRHNV